MQPTCCSEIYDDAGNRPVSFIYYTGQKVTQYFTKDGSFVLIQAGSELALILNDQDQAEPVSNVSPRTAEAGDWDLDEDDGAKMPGENKEDMDYDECA